MVGNAVGRICRRLTMSDMFLTPDEMKELTRRIQHRSQARELNHLGIMHKVRADGSILVLRPHVEEILGLKTTSKPVREFQPNWAAAAESSRTAPLGNVCPPEDC